MSLLRPRVRDGRGGRAPLRLRWFEAMVLPPREMGLWTAFTLVPLGLLWASVAWLKYLQRSVMMGGDSPMLRLSEAVGSLAATVLVTVIPLVLIVLASLSLMRLVFWPRLGWQWILRRGRCPSCRYDLRELAPEPDGCTVCPECGAGWRLPGERSKAAGQQSGE